MLMKVMFHDEFLRQNTLEKLMGKYFDNPGFMSDLVKVSRIIPGLLDKETLNLLTSHSNAKVRMQSLMALSEDFPASALESAAELLTDQMSNNRQESPPRCPFFGRKSNFRRFLGSGRVPK